MNKKNILPSLSTTFSQNGNVAEKRKLNDEVYKQFKLDQKNRTGLYKRTDSPIITLEMLESAPMGFFAHLERMVHIVSSDIINTISSNESSIYISRHRKNPTNKEIKDTILFIVMAEFSRIDRTNDEIKVLKPVDKDILLAMVINEIIGLGPLEPLWNDNTITEIIINGPYDVQIEVDGIIRRVPSVKFRDQEHLMTLINKLFSSINKQLSPIRPRERGRLHDNSRIYAVHPVVAPNGPNFNIRKHTEEYWSPLDIIERGTANKEIMEYLGGLIYGGISFLVVGGTGTGKTTLLNSLTGFIPNNLRIVTLEENLEMKPHPGKLLAAPMECLPAKVGNTEEFGVTMRDLVRSSLQMRPDWIFIGEVSDGAAYDLCQALNTGHYGGSSVHANDAKDAVERMRSLVSQEEFVRGPAVLDLIGSAFDVLIVLDRMDDGSRKIVEVVELGRNPVLAENNQLSLETIPLWEFQAEDSYDDEGKLKINGDWKQVGELSEYRQKKHRLNLSKKKTWEELLEISTYISQEEEDY